MVGFTGINASLPFLRTSMPPSENRDSQAPETGRMSTTGFGNAAEGRNSVATRQGDGLATKPSSSDATTTWMKAKFGEAKSGGHGIQIGAHRAQAGSVRDAGSTRGADRIATAQDDVGANEADKSHYTPIGRRDGEHYNTALSNEGGVYGGTGDVELDDEIVKHYENADPTNDEANSAAPTEGSDALSRTDLDAGGAETARRTSVSADELQRARSDTSGHSAPASDLAMLTSGYMRG